VAQLHRHEDRRDIQTDGIESREYEGRLRQRGNEQDSDDYQKK
jgi:hypothetical protein